MSAARTTCRARPARASKRFSSSKAASSHGRRAAVVVRAGPYDEELVATAKTIANSMEDNPEHASGVDLWRKARLTSMVMVG